MKSNMHVRQSFFMGFLLFSVFASGCGTASPPKTSVANENIIATPLTEAEALKRFSQVSKISYSLWFGLEEKLNEFSGKTTLQFDLQKTEKDPNETLFLDFYQGTLSSITVNGKPVTDFTSPKRYDGNRIYFKMGELNTGTNHVEIAFKHSYNHNGHGLHRFVDPVDQAVYLYTDLEPYFAHHVFPSFDQPDLKAQFQLTVEAPKSWSVVTNTREIRVTALKEDFKRWVFPATQKLSSYVIALVAGEYKKFDANYGSIPLRVFCRKSLAQYVDAPEWFDVTRKGLKFFGTQFGRAYPFLKYDQILVPEFDEGAMENVGAVTFSERMVYRSKQTRLIHQRRADTILHEMAHMWFGDLVTMKWWNGLWLNESFATFMSTWAMSETTPISGTNHDSAWIDFANEKAWAYWQDQLVTTHPIELPVPDTDHAFSNFDGITYAKGASVIKQLRYYLGEDNFRKGLQNYFKKYAYQNTRLEDFMGSLAEASRKNLNDWQKVWLMTPGVNSVKVDWECKDGNISKMDLLQSPSGNNQILRPHSTEIGFYSFNNAKKQSGKLILKNKIAITYETASTPIVAKSTIACPAFIFPNADDQDYIKVELDEKSLSVISEHLTEIDNILIKKMLWHSLSEMVVDGKLSPKRFADIVLKQLPSEGSLEIQQDVLQAVLQIIAYFNTDIRNEYFPKLEALTLDGMQKSSPGSDNQLVWFHSFVGFAHSPSALQTLSDILNGKLLIPNLKIDQEVRWILVQTLTKRGATSDAETLIAAELKADPTAMGKKSRLIAEVARPDPALKAEWANKIFAAAPTGKTADFNSSDLGVVMSSFHVLGQEALSEAILDRYFKFLPEAAKSTDELYIEYYTQGFFPALCTQKVIDMTTEALKGNLPVTAQKNLKVQRQENERCLRARKL